MHTASLLLFYCFQPTLLLRSTIRAAISCASPRRGAGSADYFLRRSLSETRPDLDTIGRIFPTVKCFPHVQVAGLTDRRAEPLLPWIRWFYAALFAAKLVFIWFI